MELSVSTYSLGRWCRENHKSLDQCLSWMAGAGIKAVEFVGLDDKAETIGKLKRADQIRRRCDRLGLAVAAYCVGAELLSTPKVQRDTVKRLKGEVDIAAELGCKTMRHDITRGWDGAKGLRGPKTLGQALKIVVPAIRAIADHAGDRDIITSLENHGFYMQASPRIQKLIQAVNHSHFALTIDMGNFLCVNENPVDAVKRLCKYTVMAHVKDFHVKPKNRMPQTGWFATPTSIALRGAIVGHGAIDVPAQLRLLKRAGYKGYLSLEFEGMEEPTMAVLTGLEYLRKQLRAIKALDRGL